MFGATSTEVRSTFVLFIVWFVSSQPSAHASDEFQMFAPHHVMRRSVSVDRSPSLQAVFTPVVHNVTYYNIGDKISFTMNLTHNQSASVIVPDRLLKITLKSDFLKPDRASFKQVSNLSMSKDVVNDTALYFEISALTAPDELSVTFDATVKTSIHPLANLFFTLHVTGQDGSNNEFSFGPVSSQPTLYAVFPKVTLTRTSSQDMWVYSTTGYIMRIIMPHLNFSLLVELSAAINDFSFMEIHNVTVNKVGSNIGAAPGGKLNPEPEDKKSESTNLTDRVILDFKDLLVAGAEESKNTIEIAYNVTIKDNPQLFNDSKHWVGAGMRSGYQMLWVGQEAMYIYKDEPTLTGVVTALNDTANKRYFIGDVVTVEWHVNHTNNSYQGAQNVVLAVSSTAFEIVSGTFQKSGDSEQLLPANRTIAVGSLQLGEYVTGYLTLKVTENISPLQNLDISLQISYKNSKGVAKMSTTHKPVPDYVAGVPGFSLKLNSSTNRITVGGRATFFFKVLLRKMRSPLKVEIILPVNQTSIMALTYVKVLSVGKNIENVTSTTPTLNSTVNDPELYDRAKIDFGTAKSTVGTLDSPDNEIVVEFEIVVNDHLNVTNGSKHWVAVGVRGGERMIWVGETALVADVPNERRPVLKIMANCFIPGTQNPCVSSNLNRGDKVYYNGSVEHVLAESQRYAGRVNVLWMIPPYVKPFNALMGMDKLQYQWTEAGPLFKFNNRLHFKDRLSFSFAATLDPDSQMPSGNTYAVSPVQLSYTAYEDAHFLGAPLMPISFSFKVPEPGPSVPSDAPPLKEMYRRGFLLDNTSNHLYLCQLSDDSAKPSCFFTKDNGASWAAMDLQVGCVIGQSGETLYGISRNERAYLRQAARNKAWYAIAKSVWEDEKKQNPSIGNGLVNNLTGELPSNPDSVIQKVAKNNDKWAATQNGLYVNRSGNGPWKLIAKWKCCG